MISGEEAQEAQELEKGSLMLRRLRSRGDWTRAQEELRRISKAGLFRSLKIGLVLGEIC
jgi:GH24 family phage-related lysozyme (muramidase)